MSTKAFTKIIGVIVGIVVALVVSFAGIRALSRSTSQPTPAPAISPRDERETPGDRNIKLAEARIRNLPNSPEGYNQLAAAYMQKARETGNFDFNSKAEALLNQSLQLDPHDSSTLTLHATLLLTFHRFREALEVAKRAQQFAPDNADLFGVMTDALVELGDYTEAVKAAQTMMNLRPDAAAYARASYLRALHGDIEGAIEAMQVAVKAASPSNAENAGWFRVHLGLEMLAAGKKVEGEREIDVALEILPNYHLALAAKGRARAAAGDFDQAIDFYKKAQQRVPLPETAIALGDLYTKVKKPAEAQRQYALVDFIERTSAVGSTYSRQLALFWADHDMKLDEALEIMQREREVRADIYTSDALAWCLYKKGQLSQAAAAIEQATRLGTRDARIFYHAGLIYDSLGDQRRASKYLKLALSLDPAFDLLQAGVARQKLDELTRRSSKELRGNSVLMRSLKPPSRRDRMFIEASTLSIKSAPLGADCPQPGEISRSNRAQADFSMATSMNISPLHGELTYLMTVPQKEASL
ncbi:MAG TPA: tetratricopeptide repeat protein [Pyrinomonadaceae bacterium]|nr:tetratricopeptide repeat protein [Pyrinomonadaceae bacterium]